MNSSHYGYEWWVVKDETRLLMGDVEDTTWFENSWWRGDLTSDVGASGRASSMKSAVLSASNHKDFIAARAAFLHELDVAAKWREHCRLLLITAQRQAFQGDSAKRLTQISEQMEALEWRRAELVQRN